MNLLVDNQLPTALARFLADRGFACRHVLDLGMEASDDRKIWQFAKDEKMVIVTKDEDFALMADHHGEAASCPPSLSAALLSALLVRLRSTLGRGSPPGLFKGPASPPCQPLVVQLRTCTTLRALTPVSAHLHRQVSPFTSHCRLIVPPPTT